MGSNIGHWPSFNPHNFAQLRPTDPSHHSVTPATYHPTHNRTVPPEGQVIGTEGTNILLRHLFRRPEEKARPKRPAADSGSGQEAANKQPRTAHAHDGWVVVDNDVPMEEIQWTPSRGIDLPGVIPWARPRRPSQ